MYVSPIKLFTVAELAVLPPPAFLALCHDEIAGVFPRRMISPAIPTTRLALFASASGWGSCWIV